MNAMTLPEQSSGEADRAAFRATLRALKEAIRSDVPTIRAAKVACRQAQQEGRGSRDQAELAAVRRRARARLLAYGLARGHSWAEMEPNHAEGEARLFGLIQRAWREAAIQAASEAGREEPCPQEIIDATGGRLWLR